MPEPRDEQAAALAPIYKRCWCWQYGRCLVDCPTADVPKPRSMTDANWQRAYADALDAASLQGDT